MSLVAQACSGFIEKSGCISPSLWLSASGGEKTGAVTFARSLLLRALDFSGIWCFGFRI